MNPPIIVLVNLRGQFCEPCGQEKTSEFNPHYSQFIYSKAKLTAVYGNAQKY